MKVLITTPADTVSFDVSSESGSITVSAVTCFKKVPEDGTPEEESYVTKEIAHKEIESDEFTSFLNGDLKKNGYAYFAKHYILLRYSFYYYIFSFDGEDTAAEFYDTLSETVKTGIEDEKDVCFCDVRKLYDCAVISGEKAESLYAELMNNRF